MISTAGARAEHDQAQGQARLSAEIMSAVTSLVVVVDSNGRVVELNQAARTFLGTTDEETHGRSFYELFWGESVHSGAWADVDALVAAGSRAADTDPATAADPVIDTAVELAGRRGRPLLELATGAIGRQLLIERLADDGSLRWIRWTAGLVTDEDGAISHIVATGVDVTADRVAHEQLMESSRRYRALLDNASDLVICVDANGLLTHLSPAVYDRLGYEPAEWMGREAFELVHPDDLDEAVRSFDRTITMEADQSPMTVRIRTAAGTWTPFEVFAKNQLDEPDVRAVVVSMRDITARLRHETELEQSREALMQAERQFRSSFDHAAIGMALVGLDGEFLQVNRSLCEFVGRPESDLLTCTFQEITHPEDLASDLGLLGELVRGERLDYQLDKRYLRPDGSSVWAQLNVTLVRNQHGNPMHFVSQIQDITERRSMHDALLEQANHDSLTGLVNRACFSERLDAACAAVGEHGWITVVFIDLNEFKVVNDTYGHEMGDVVLQRAAHRVRDALRPGDLAARIGGDEMAAVLVGADEVRAVQVVERLRSAIAEPIEVAGHRLSLSASIGHVSTNVPVEAGTLLRQADLAMYADKRARS